jgi:hypothetical protein
MGAEPGSDRPGTLSNQNAEVSWSGRAEGIRPSSLAKR